MCYNFQKNDLFSIYWLLINKYLRIPIMFEAGSLDKEINILGTYSQKSDSQGHLGGSGS